MAESFKLLQASAAAMDHIVIGLMLRLNKNKEVVM